MLEIYLLIFIIVSYIALSFTTTFVKYGGNRIENVLIVDVANMYITWKHETKEKGSYLVCIDRHYNEFIKYNNINTCALNYVVKNTKYYDKFSKKNMNREVIGQKEWDAINNFVKTHNNTTISVAEDYSDIEYDKWMEKHYIRGSDDYLCFLLARQYKRDNVNAVIMSNDKYKDFVELGYVPHFTASIVNKDIVKQNIQPRMNDLGQLSDFRLSNITLEFAFNDKNFTKNSTYKIHKPGCIWI